MHVKSTAAIAALIAAAAVASPTGYGADGPHSEQHQLAGQVPFLAEQPARQTAAQAESNPMYAGSLSLEPFRTLLEPSQYDQLAEHVDSLPERRIIALSERVQDNRLVTEGQKALLTFHGIKFIDVTESVLLEAAAGKASLHTDNNNNKDSSDAAFPKNWTYGREELQTKFYKNIDTSRMKRFLQAFSSFRTRYYRSSDGRQSQLFLLEKIQQIVSSNENKHLKITAEEFPHPWGQNSIIVKLPANDTANAKGTIVVGAHQDSTNLLPFLSAPGADDDGSGTTTVMEVLHILTQAGYIPRTHNVEFHFYSAEEGGMLGSQAIVNDYQKRVKRAHRGEHVQAMLQMDMTAYVKPGTKERIGIIQDFVSPTLTEFVHRLIDEYNDIPSVQTACNYACSDHSSWTRIGVPSAFAIEATFEDSNTRHIHTSGDTIDVEGFSFDHMAQFVQLATAFVLELSS